MTPYDVGMAVAVLTEASRHAPEPHATSLSDTAQAIAQALDQFETSHPGDHSRAPLSLILRLRSCRWTQRQQAQAAYAEPPMPYGGKAGDGAGGAPFSNTGRKSTHGGTH